MFIDTARLRDSYAWKRTAQLALVLLCALVLKQAYSTSSPNELRWILTPTTFLVQLITGTSFTFESHAGYISSDRSFVIAASCAGVNFLITSFLMLALSRLWKHRLHPISWGFIPLTLAFAYMATLIANTVRISTALRLRHTPLGIGGLNPNQLHRFEGILIYFGFLLLLYVIDETLSRGGRPTSNSEAVLPASVHKGPVFPSRPLSTFRVYASETLRQILFPLFIYYGTTLGIPLANGAYRQGTDFWEHSLFVIATPVLLILPLAVFRLYSLRR